MQRLTNLCSVLNDMEPICVLNHVFVLREVKHFSSFPSFFISLNFSSSSISPFAWMVTKFGEIVLSFTRVLYLASFLSLILLSDNSSSICRFFLFFH